MKLSHTWLQTYFADPLPEPNDIAELLTFHAFEVEGVEEVSIGVGTDVINDVMYDVDILANRSSDCLSHRGIARELSVLLSIPLKKDPLREAIPAWPTPEALRATVDDYDKAPRHMVAYVRGVSVGPSPDWLVARLQAVGQRSINNIVDATNYVMLDLGQPVHAFDFDKLTADSEGVVTLAVTDAKDHERIELLGGETRELSERNLVIRDKASGTALDIAGIKGGTAAELTNETTSIAVDCANFNYVSIRKTSRELKVQTDASVRFQNEPSAHLPAFAMRDVLALIQEIAGGEVVGVSDDFEPPPSHMPVSASLAEINGVLGTAMTPDDIERILVRFEYEFSRDEDTFTVTPPWERTDIRIPADLIEELGRVYGYNNLVGVMPPVAPAPALNKRFFYEEKVRHLLGDMGYSEVYTYTLQNKGEVELVNPLAADKGFLRPSLVPGMRDALDKNTTNAPLFGADTLKLFELGTVFRTEGEYLALALGVRAIAGKQSRANTMLDEDVANLSQALGSELVGTNEDGVFETAFEAALPDLPDPSGYLPPLPYKTATRFRQWSPYPFVLRDLALWVPEHVPAEEPLAVIIAMASDLLVRHDLFDTFTKEGKTSYAFHLVWQAPDRTLTDDEVGKEMEVIEQALRERGWEVR